MLSSFLLMILVISVAFYLLIGFGVGMFHVRKNFAIYDELTGGYAFLKFFLAWPFMLGIATCKGLAKFIGKVALYGKRPKPE